MHRVFNKFILGVFSLLLFQNSLLAIEAEFKNSLIKVDVVRVSESSYTVNLYTQNKFLEPVKIIKKSDLNYYILLPETKNSQTKTVSNGSEIRNVTTNLYPYAGQDVNNGYTKININTTRPINFNVNVKNMASASKIATNVSEKAIASSQIAKKEVQKEVQTQKKNLQKTSANVASNQTKPKASQPKKQAVKPQVAEQKPKTMKVSEAVKNEIEKSKEEIKEITPPVQDVIVEQEVVQVEQDGQEEVISSEEVKEIEQIAQESNKNDFLLKILSKLNEYNNGIFLAILATLFTFIVVFKILSRKTDIARLKSKADLVDKTEESVQNPQVTQEPEVKNDGQYFVFEKNVKQTGFCDPATSAIKRNYELSSYEPELKDRYDRAEIGTYHPSKVNVENKDSEYDIIQKILKEDSFIDISADEYNEAKDSLVDDEVLNNNIGTTTSADVEEVVQEVVSEEPIAEPEVLSSVEIAPERGFMCVSYNGNINLMGYIFDEVFALYNFKLPKLENYDIKFRLSEKDETGARFIIKAGEMKLLVKVTKNSMKTEVLL